MKSSFFSDKELSKIGLLSYGINCLISKKASFYSPECISLGDNVRIDDFCILSGHINIGSWIHISAYSSLYAKFGIEISDFVTISSRVSIFSQSDDYSGLYMTNPIVPEEFTSIKGGKVVFERHSIVGAGSIVLPGITFHEGSCAGALSLVKQDLEEWKIYGGIPAKYIRDREKNILILEQKLWQERNY